MSRLTNDLLNARLEGRRVRVRYRRPADPRSRPPQWNDAPTKSSPALRANRCRFRCYDDEERVVSANHSMRRPPPNPPRRAPE